MGWVSCQLVLGGEDQLSAGVDGLAVSWMWAGQLSAVYKLDTIRPSFGVHAYVEFRTCNSNIEIYLKLRKT